MFSHLALMHVYLLIATIDSIVESTSLIVVSSIFVGT